MARCTAAQRAPFTSGGTAYSKRVRAVGTRCAAARHHQQQQQQSSSRRQLLVAAPLLTSLAMTPVSLAADEAASSSGRSGNTYLDPVDGFSLSVPAGWASGEGVLDGNTSFGGASGARRTLAWFPPDVPADKVNVTVTITNTSVEITSLGSLGNVYAFGSNLVNQMDKSYLLRRKNNTLPVQIAKLVDVETRRGQYWVEYWVQAPPAPQRHLFSQVALANNGRYNRLYTVTAQCLEEDLGRWGPVLEGVLASFQPPEPVA